MKYPEGTTVHTPTGLGVVVDNKVFDEPGKTQVLMHKFPLHASGYRTYDDHEIFIMPVLKFANTDVYLCNIKSGDVLLNKTTGEYHVYEKFFHSLPGNIFMIAISNYSGLIDPAKFNYLGVE